MSALPQPLSYFLDLDYPYSVVPDGGSYFIEFPDLPNCMTQVEDASDIPAMAEEIRTLWIESEYARGNLIPEPTKTLDYSGKFLLRIPRSLHRKLSVAARKDGVSLNQYASQLLAQSVALDELYRQADRIERAIRDVHERLPDDVNRGLRLVAEGKASYRAE